MATIRYAVKHYGFARKADAIAFAKQLVATGKYFEGRLTPADGGGWTLMMLKRESRKPVAFRGRRVRPKVVG